MIPTSTLPFARKGLCLLLALSHVCVFAAPAQEPLLTASSGPKPNVVLTLDDSGSMNWHMMPTEIGQTVRYSTTRGPQTGSATTYQRKNLTFLNSTNAVRTKCNNYYATNTPNPLVVPPNTAPPTTNNIRNDCYQAPGTTPIYGPDVYVAGTTRVQLYPRIHPNDHDGNGRNTDGVVDTNQIGYNGVGNLYAARFRSSDINGNYYNPNATYEPWPASARNIPANLINADGSIANLRTVPLYPEGAPSGATITTANLLDEVNEEANWCAEGMTSSGSTALDGTCPSNTRTFSPAVYFQLTAGRAGTSISDFTPVNINTITDATTRAFQQRNFAIWFTYYRNRILTAKGAVALAFQAQKDSQFRLGYGRINRGISLTYDRNGNIQASKTTQTVDGYSSLVMQQGVRSFDNRTAETHRNTFMTWLRNLPASGGTPLRMAMQDVGEYFKTASPYRTDPTSTSSPELSCRRNYHILVTDGYWNDPNSEVNTANEDGSAGATYNQPNSTFTYGYTNVAPFTDNANKTLADVAMKYWKTDLRGTLGNDIPITAEAKAAPNNPDNNPAFWQHMVNFTVGLGVDGSINSNSNLNSISWPAPTAEAITTIDDLWHAAVNSRGKYLSAKDPINFARSLSSILSNITATGGTVSGVALSRATLASGTLKFEPSFEPNKWSGELAAISLSATTGAEGNTLWNASHNVPAHGSRNLWMGTGTTSATSFVATNVTGTTPLGHIKTGGNNAGVAPSLEEGRLVNYLRGDNSNEGPEAFRQRKTVTLSDGTIKTNVLGSMVNSVPIFVKATNFGNRFLPGTVEGQSTGSGTYNQFLTQKRSRNGLVLVGANDGMLHGFRASDGVEMFGFIPGAVLKGESHPNSTASNLFGMARLADPNYEHQFYVDGQLAEGDVSVCSGESCSWKNIVVGSTGGGARSVFAIDVSNNFNTDSSTAPTLFGASNFLWELGASDRDLGYVMSSAEIGMLPSGTWVAVFGNGYGSPEGRAILYVVNAITGEVIQKIQAGTATDNGLSGVRLVRDADNLIRHAYAGDLNGNLWKFDMTNMDVDLDGIPLFQAGASQPIMATPNYALHPKQGVMVVVPTGRLYSPADQSSTGQQTIYGFWDKATIGSTSTSGSAIVDTNLSSKVVQSGAANATRFTIINDGSAPTNNRGWKLRMLFANGERGIYMPQFINNFTYVETVKPGQLETESCSISEGSGYGYLINTFTGAQPASPIVDVTGDGTIDSADNYGVFKRSDKGRGTVVSGGGASSPGGIVGDGGDNNAPPLATDPLGLDRNRFWRQIFWTIN